LSTEVRQLERTAIADVKLGISVFFEPVQITRVKNDVSFAVKYSISQYWAIRRRQTNYSGSVDSRTGQFAEMFTQNMAESWYYIIVLNVIF